MNPQTDDELAAIAMAFALGLKMEEGHKNYSGWTPVLPEVQDKYILEELHRYRNFGYRWRIKPHD